MPATTKKSKPTHPPYAVMIKEAIVTLKERTGSSRQALRKFIGAKYKLPDGWEKKLSLYLKKMTIDGALVQVKASWKLGEKLKKMKKESTTKDPKKMKMPRKTAAKSTTAKAKTATKKMTGKKAAVKKKRTPMPDDKKVKGVAMKSRAKQAAKKATPKTKRPSKKTTGAAKKAASKTTQPANKRAAAAAKK